ncbi:hypothetical protein D3C87_1905460 [compost metagenome]
MRHRRADRPGAAERIDQARRLLHRDRPQVDEVQHVVGQVHTAFLPQQEEVHRIAVDQRAQPGGSGGMSAKRHQTHRYSKGKRVESGASTGRRRA